jgi:hypothetical protein
MENDGNISLIVDNPLGILDQQLRPHLIHLLNIIILINYSNLYKIKLLILETDDHTGQRRKWTECVHLLQQMVLELKSFRTNAVAPGPNVIKLFCP